MRPLYHKLNIARRMYLMRMHVQLYEQREPESADGYWLGWARPLGRQNKTASGKPPAENRESPILKLSTTKSKTAVKRPHCQNNTSGGRGRTQPRHSEGSELFLCDSHFWSPRYGRRCNALYPTSCGMLLFSLLQLGDTSAPPLFKISLIPAMLDVAPGP
jgi:hypothetical protein